MRRHWPGKTKDWDGIQVDAGTNIWIDHVKVRGFTTLARSFVNNSSADYWHQFARMNDGLIDPRKGLRLHHHLELHSLRTQQGVRNRMEAERDGKSNDQQQLLQLDQRPQSQRRQLEDVPHVQLLPPQPNLRQPCSRSRSADRRNVVSRRRRPECHDQVELAGVQGLRGPDHA